MFPVTIKGVTFPCFYNTQSQAMAAATSYFESLGDNIYDFTILKATTENGKVYFVLRDENGDALPVPTPAPVAYDVLEA